MRRARALVFVAALCVGARMMRIYCDPVIAVYIISAILVKPFYMCYINICVHVYAYLGN